MHATIITINQSPINNIHPTKKLKKQEKQEQKNKKNKKSLKNHLTNKNHSGIFSDREAKALWRDPRRLFFLPETTARDAQPWTGFLEKSENRNVWKEIHMSNSVPQMYGSYVFNDKIMRDKLPKDVYKALKKTIDNGSHLELDVANAVAIAMKEWAVENGATHFTHWFQPMTGITAEKHDSFISPVGDGEIIMEFSEKS